MNKENELEAALPNYDNCLVNLAGSILRKFGADTDVEPLKIAEPYLAKDYKNVVVLVLDAMGTKIMEKHLKEDGFFRSHMAGAYDSVFPPTTVAATTSLMSGLYPDEHGWLGWDVYYPQLQKNISVFRNCEQKTEKEDAKPASFDKDGNPVWDADSIDDHPAVADYHVGFRFTPYKSIVDQITDAGGKAYFSMPFMPPFPQTLDEILDRITKLCKEPNKKFIYAYWNEPDSTMHATGTMSDKTHEMVTSLEKKIEGFSEGLEDTLLIVTADHGHMDSRNLCILDYPEVMKCLVRLPSIEPRTLNLFVKDEYKDEFPRIFAKAFGDRFLLMTREEVISSRLFGIGEDHKELSGMLGDYLAIATAEVSVFTTHYEAQMMPGGHAGLTPEEIAIPFIVIEKGE